MALLKEGRVVEDPFLRVREDDDLPNEGGVIVDLARWLERRDELIAREGGIGVELAPGESPEQIAGDLQHLDVVALDFPAFGDGRAFSSARVLRDRLGFEGEVRAVGDVELEQLHFMSRVGFNSFVIDSEDPEQDWVTAHRDLDLWYQPTEDGRATVREKRRS